MFTGIIEEVGVIRSIRKSGDGKRITVSAKRILEELKIGDSISISGACLTVISFDHSDFTVEAVEETLRKTSFGILRAGGYVNLERALRAGDRLGGHFVQGHIDGRGKIARIEKRKSSWICYVSYPSQFSKYVIPQGSIAMDGISLTIAEKMNDSQFMVSIIPHTFNETVVKNYRTGSLINLEFDMIGKYIIGFISTQEQFSFSAKKLLESGY